MDTLTIHLFGKMQVKRGEQALEDLNTRKLQELLAYLFLYRQQLHRREALANLFWDKQTTSQSLKYLRQALWQLQSVLNTDQDTNTNLIRVEAEWVDLNSRADLWLDVAIFEDTFDRVRDIHGRTLDRVNVKMLQDAVQLYQGDLLEGWYQDWCLYERERLQNIYLMMLDKLMDYCEAHCEYEAGLAYGVCILRYDRARERTHRRMMRLYFMANDRTAAIRQYERCKVALEQELGVRPARKTLALYEQICKDQPNDLRLTWAQSIPTPEAVIVSSTAVLDHVRQVEEVLENVRSQVQQIMQMVELVVDHKR